MSGYMYVPRENRFQNQMFSLLSNALMQNMAYKQEKELRASRQEFETERENRRTQLQLETSGYTPMSQEESNWQQTGQVKPDFTVGGKGYKRPTWKKIVAGGQQLGFQRGNQIIQTSQKEDYFKLGNELIKIENGRAIPIYESKSGEKEWKPTTREEKMAYDRFVADTRAKAQQRYKVRNPTTKVLVDSEGKATALTFGDDGKLRSKEDLGKIGRKGTTNIWDVFGGQQPSGTPTSEGTGYENGFEGRGMYPVDGVKTQINTQEEYNRILGIGE